MPKPTKKQESDDESFPEDEEFAGFSSDDEVNSDDFDEEFSGDEDGDLPSESKQEEKPKCSKHILQLRQKLGLDELIQKKKEALTTEALKPSVSDPSKPQPLVVVYNDPSKRKKKKLEDRGMKKPRADEEEYDEPTDLIKAKHEVKRFAMQAMKSKTKGKEEARVQLAVSLGAVAPKQKLVNYKVYKQQKTKELARAKRLKEADNIFASKIQSMVKKNKVKKQDKNKVTNFDSDFGRLTKNKKRKKSRK